VDAGYVSLTALHVDLTAHAAQGVLSDWLIQAEVKLAW
jgi:5'-nucleotidase